MPAPAGGVPERSTPQGRAQLDAALDRVLAVLAGLGRTVGRFALVALVAGAAIWWAVAGGGTPDQDRTVLSVVVALVVLLPPAILLLFVLAVRALASVVTRLREAPGTIRERAGEIRRRAGEVSRARRKGFGGTMLALFRFWWAVGTSREVVEVVGPAMVLLSPWTLIAAGFAFVGAGVEILAGVVAVIILALR